MNGTRICLTLSQLQNFSSLHPKLRQVVDDVMDVWPNKTLIIISIYRSKAKDKQIGGSGVHSTTPHRAIDARIANLKDGFQEKADEVADVINTIWSYDPSRRNLHLAIAKLHGTGPHLHLQVHPRTKRNMLN